MGALTWWLTSSSSLVYTSIAVVIALLLPSVVQIAPKATNDMLPTTQAMPENGYDNYIA